MKIFKLVNAIILAIPFYFLWNYLAPIYLPQVTAPYVDVPFWHIAGIFMLIQIVKMMLMLGRSRWGRGCHHRHHHHYDKFGMYGYFGKKGFWTRNYRHQ